MPEKILESFSVKRLDILDEEGNADESLMPSLPDAEIRRMYEMLVFARTFDQRALSLQREGRIGTYAPIYGQEASQIGSALALEKQDWIFPSFRENGVYLAVGQPPNRILQYWGGDERGLRTSEDMNIFPVSIPVGSHVPHAAGAAMAAKYRACRSLAAARSPASASRAAANVLIVSSMLKTFCSLSWRTTSQEESTSSRAVAAAAAASISSTYWMSLMPNAPANTLSVARLRCCSALSRSKLTRSTSASRRPFGWPAS